MLATSLATSALDLRGAGPGGRPGTNPVASRPKLITFGLGCNGGSPCDGNGSIGMTLGMFWPGSGGGGTCPCPGNGGGMSCPASRSGDGKGGIGLAASRLTVVAGSDGCRPCGCEPPSTAEGGGIVIIFPSGDGSCARVLVVKSSPATAMDSTSAQHPCTESRLAYGSMKKGLHESVPRLTCNVSPEKR